MSIYNLGNMFNNVLILQAIGSPDATEHIMRSLLFYTVTNLEAFIFCFAGEYLKNKVRLNIITKTIINNNYFEFVRKRNNNIHQ